MIRAFRSSAGQLAAFGVTLGLAGSLVAGCTSTSGGDQPSSAADVTSQLGAVPVPSASVGAPAPVNASVGHPQLLAMGAPVLVTLPNGTRALITTSGPTENLPPSGARPGSTVTGKITIAAKVDSGSLRLATSDLSSRDQNGKQIALHADGPAEVVASKGHPATLKLAGTFADGSAQINWQQQGHLLAMWDFTIEID